MPASLLNKKALAAQLGIFLIIVAALVGVTALYKGNLFGNQVTGAATYPSTTPGDLCTSTDLACNATINCDCAAGPMIVCDNGANGNVMTNDTTCSGHDGVRITQPNVIFDCQGKTITGDGTNVGIVVEASNVKIQNCRLENFATGIQVKTINNVEIINTYVNSTLTGVQIEDGAGAEGEEIILTNVVIDSSKSNAVENAGVTAKNAYVKIIGTNDISHIIAHNESPAISVSNTHLTVSNSLIEGSYGISLPEVPAIYADSSSVVLISDNEIRGDYGIQVFNGSSGTISKNKFTKIITSAIQIRDAPSNSTVIEENDFFDSGNYPIHIFNTPNVVVRSNKIRSVPYFMNATQSGIYINYSPDALIELNEIDEAEYAGIEIINAPSTVINNKIKNASVGISISNTAGGYFSGNQISSSTIGISTSNAFDMEFFDNTISSVETGVDVGSSNLLFDNLHISGCTGSGVSFMTPSDNVTIQNSDISGCINGIYLGHSSLSNIQIINNTLTNNVRGISNNHTFSILLGTIAYPIDGPLYIDNNHLEGNDQISIIASNSQGTFSDNTLVNEKGAHFQFYSGGVISRNKFNNLSGSIYLKNSQYAVFSDNNITYDGTDQMLFAQNVKHSQFFNNLFYLTNHNIVYAMNFRETENNNEVWNNTFHSAGPIQTGLLFFPPDFQFDSTDKFCNAVNGAMIGNDYYISTLQYYGYLLLGSNLPDLECDIAPPTKTLQKISPYNQTTEIVTVKVPFGTFTQNVTVDVINLQYKGLHSGLVFNYTPVDIGGKVRGGFESYPPTIPKEGQCELNIFNINTLSVLGWPEPLPQYNPIANSILNNETNQFFTDIPNDGLYAWDVFCQDHSYFPNPDPAKELYDYDKDTYFSLILSGAHNILGEDYGRRFIVDTKAPPAPVLWEQHPDRNIPGAAELLQSDICGYFAEPDVLHNNLTDLDMLEAIDLSIDHGPAQHPFYKKFIGCFGIRTIGSDNLTFESSLMAATDGTTIADSVYVVDSDVKILARYITNPANCGTTWACDVNITQPGYSDIGNFTMDVLDDNCPGYMNFNYTYEDVPAGVYNATINCSDNGANKLNTSIMFSVGLGVYEGTSQNYTELIFHILGFDFNISFPNEGLFVHTEPYPINPLTNYTSPGTVDVIAEHTVNMSCQNIFPNNCTFNASAPNGTPILTNVKMYLVDMQQVSDNCYLKFSYPIYNATPGVFTNVNVTCVANDTVRSGSTNFSIGGTYDGNVLGPQINYYLQTYVSTNTSNGYYHAGEVIDIHAIYTSNDAGCNIDWGCSLAIYDPNNTLVLNTTPINPWSSTCSGPSRYMDFKYSYTVPSNSIGTYSAVVNCSNAGIAGLLNSTALFSITDLDFTCGDSVLINESVLTLEPAWGLSTGHSDYVTFINYTPVAEAAFKPGNYVEFANHNKTFFTRYEIQQADVLGNEIRLNFTEPFEFDIPIGTPVYVFSARVPRYWFLIENATLYRGLNRLSAYGIDTRYNNGPGADSWIVAYNTALDISAQCGQGWIPGGWYSGPRCWVDYPIEFRARYVNSSDACAPLLENSSCYISLDGELPAKEMLRRPSTNPNCPGYEEFYYYDRYFSASDNHNYTISCYVPNQYGQANNTAIDPISKTFPIKIIDMGIEYLPNVTLWDPHVRSDPGTAYLLNMNLTGFFDINDLHTYLQQFLTNANISNYFNYWDSPTLTFLNLFYNQWYGQQFPVNLTNSLVNPFTYKVVVLNINHPMNHTFYIKQAACPRGTIDSEYCDLNTSARYYQGSGCLQENANAITGVCGNDTGTYTFFTNQGSWVDSSNTTDNDWDTSGLCSFNGGGSGATNLWCEQFNASSSDGTCQTLTLNNGSYMVGAVNATWTLNASMFDNDWTTNSTCGDFQGYTWQSSPSPYWCPQENSNISPRFNPQPTPKCDGTDTGYYNFTGNWNGTETNFTDNDYNTPALCKHLSGDDFDPTCTVLTNYTIPAGASTANWTIMDETMGSPVNLTIPSDCWNATGDNQVYVGVNITLDVKGTFSGEIEIIPATNTSNITWYCVNATGNHILANHDGYDISLNEYVGVYEETMHWYIDDPMGALAHGMFDDMCLMAGIYPIPTGVTDAQWQAKYADNFTNFTIPRDCMNFSDNLTVFYFGANSSAGLAYAVGCVNESGLANLHYFHPPAFQLTSSLDFFEESMLWNWGTRQSLWDTPYSCVMFINYTKPTNATAAQWNYKFGMLSQSPVDIPQDCFDYSPSSVWIGFIVSNVTVNNQAVPRFLTACQNGSGGNDFHILSNVTGKSVPLSPPVFHEESMWWSAPGFDVNATSCTASAAVQPPIQSDQLSPGINNFTFLLQNNFLKIIAADYCDFSLDKLMGPGNLLNLAGGRMTVLGPECLQENATDNSTGCGLDTGQYLYHTIPQLGSWIDSANITDNNWNTYSYCSGYGPIPGVDACLAEIFYKKPLNAGIATLQIKLGNMSNPANMTVPSECLNSPGDDLIFNIIAIHYPADIILPNTTSDVIMIYCMNSSDLVSMYDNVVYNVSLPLRFYDEAIYWKTVEGYLYQYNLTTKLDAGAYQASYSCSNPNAGAQKIFTISDYESTCNPDRLINISSLVLEPAFKGDYATFIQWSYDAERALISKPGLPPLTSRYLVFENHNKTYFKRYEVIQADRLGNEIRVLVSEPFEKNISIGTLVDIYADPIPWAWFQENVSLYRGLNRVTIYAFADLFDSDHIGKVAETWMYGYSTSLDIGTDTSAYVPNNSILFYASYLNQTSPANRVPDSFCNITIQGIGTYQMFQGGLSNTTFGFINGFPQPGDYTYIVNCWSEDAAYDSLTKTGTVTIYATPPMQRPVLWNIPRITKYRNLPLLGYIGSRSTNVTATVILDTNVTSTSTLSSSTPVLFIDISHPVQNLAVNTTTFYIDDTPNWQNFQPSQTERWIRFAGHNRTNFINYKVLNATKLPGSNPRLTITPALEQPVGAGETIYLYNQDRPSGYFNYSINLFEGDNMLKVFGYMNQTPGPMYQANVYYDPYMPVFNLTLVSFPNGSTPKINFIVSDNYLLNLSTLHLYENNGSWVLPAPAGWSLLYDGTHGYNGTVLDCQLMQSSPPDIYNCSLTMNFTQGKHSIFFSVQDMAGNLNYTFFYNMTIDTDSVIFDYANDEKDITDSPRLWANWSAHAPYAPIAHYEVALGTAPCANTLVCDNPLNYNAYPFTNVGLNKSINQTFYVEDGKVYYFNIKAVTATGTYGYASTNGILFRDSTPPIFTGVIPDDLGVWTNSRTILKSRFNDTFRDNESGIFDYEYSIGSAQYPAAGYENLKPRTNVNSSSFNSDNSLTVSGLPMVENKTYYFNVKARNRAFMWSPYKSSDGIKTDFTAPQGGSLSYPNGPVTTGLARLTYNWGSDPLSGFGRGYLLQMKIPFVNNQCIGSFSTAPEEELLYIGPAGLKTGIFDTVLQSGYCYKFKYRVFDVANNTVDYTSPNDAYNVSVDTSAPSPFDVFDDGFVTNTGNELNFNWTESIDPESGIDHYSWELRDGLPGTVLKTGTSTSRTITVDGLSLLNMHRYYLAVVAINKVGLSTAAYYSDGIYYDDRFSFPTVEIVSVETDNTTPYRDIIVNNETKIIVRGDFDMLCRIYDTRVDYDETFGTPCTTDLAPNNNIASCVLNGLVDGDYTEYIACKDSTGNPQEADQAAEVNFSVDEDGPDIIIASPQATTYAAQLPINISVSDLNGISYAIFNITNASGALVFQNTNVNGQYYHVFDTSDFVNDSNGTFTLTLTASDTLGHVRTVTVDFTIDNSKPTFNVTFYNLTGGAYEVLDSNPDYILSHISSDFTINVTINSFINYTINFTSQQGAVIANKTYVSLIPKTTRNESFYINVSNLDSGWYFLQVNAVNSRGIQENYLIEAYLDFYIKTLDPLPIYVLMDTSRNVNISKYFVEPRNRAMTFGLVNIIPEIDITVNQTTGIANINPVPDFIGKKFAYFNASSSGSPSVPLFVPIIVVDKPVFIVNETTWYSTAPTLNPKYPIANYSNITLNFTVVSFSGGVSALNANFTTVNSLILQSANFTNTTIDDVMTGFETTFLLEKPGQQAVKLTAFDTALPLNNGTLSFNFTLYNKLVQKVNISQ